MVTYICPTHVAVALFSFLQAEITCTQFYISKAEIHPLIYEFDTPITIEGECVLRNDHSVNGYRPTVGLFGHLHIPVTHSQ